MPRRGLSLRIVHHRDIFFGWTKRHRSRRRGIRGRAGGRSHRNQRLLFHFHDRRFLSRKAPESHWAPPMQYRGRRALSACWRLRGDIIIFGPFPTRGVDRIQRRSLFRRRFGVVVVCGFHVGQLRIDSCIEIGGFRERLSTQCRSLRSDRAWNQPQIGFPPPCGFLFWNCKLLIILIIFKWFSGKFRGH